MGERRSLFVVVVLAGFSGFLGGAPESASAADLTVANVEGLGRGLYSTDYDLRVRYLDGVLLRVVDADNPSFEQLVESVNRRLTDEEARFRVVVHVGKRNQAWWKQARVMTLSESYEMRSAGARERRAYLKTATLWDILKLVSYGWGTSEPLFFKSQVVLSPEVGGASRPLKEHLPDRGKR